MVGEPALQAAAEERRLPPEDVWEDELRRLEGIGAALESERAGEAFFAIDGLRGIHGGERRRGGRGRAGGGERCRSGSGWRRPASPPSPPRERRRGGRPRRRPGATSSARSRSRR